ncbi:MAG: T9SS type A sorting domain-containing protein, partial [Bacteroidota bacterium]
TAAGNPIDQAVYISYTLINRSPDDYKDVYVGLWIDSDLGGFADDFIGTDAKSNMYYTYNGDPIDGGALGYGLTPPAFGVMFLNRSLDFMRTYNNDFDVRGNPETPEHYYYYLQDLWKDSTFLTFGGNGYGGMTRTAYTFPGSPLDSTGWSEVTAGNTPGDRRMMGSFGPVGLPSGDTICFNVALVYARADSGNHLTSVPLLTQNALSVRNYYLQNANPCNFQVLPMDTTTQPVDTTQQPQDTTQQPVDTTQQPVDTTQQPTDTTQTFVTSPITPSGVWISPNPAHLQLNMEVTVRSAEMRIVDLQGRVLLQGQWTEGFHTISLAELPPGIYFSEIRTQQGTEVLKWIKN